MDVLGERTNIRTNLEEITLSVEEDKIFVGVIQLPDRQSGVQRGVTHLLGPLDDVLHVDVTAMRLPFRFVNRLGAVPLDEGEKFLSVQTMASFRQLRKIGVCQVVQRIADPLNQAAIVSGVFQAIEKI